MGGYSVHILMCLSNTDDHRWMVMSDCLEELDLDDNLIGDLGAKEILEALEERSEGN